LLLGHNESLSGLRGAVQSAPANPARSGRKQR